MFDAKKKHFSQVLLLLTALWLVACGELEFGVETKVSGGRPEVTVVTTTVAEIPEGMVLVTVTPSAQASAANQVTATPTAVATQPLTPTLTATPTMIPTATPTALRAAATSPPLLPTPTLSQPIVTSYTNIVDWISPGDSLTLQYEATAESALLCLAPPMSDQWDCRSAPTSGPFTFTVAPTYRTNLQLQIRLYAAGYESLIVDFLTLLCPESAWFFAGPPTTCPAGPPVTTHAAYQPFEHGWMLWLESSDMMYAFFDTPGQTFAQFYPSQIPESSIVPNNEYDPPDGRYVPTSGFGRLWRSNSWVRDSLGWALQPESGFETTMQNDIQQDASYLYVLNPDDELIVMNNYNSSWAVRSQP